MCYYLKYYILYNSKTKEGERVEDLKEQYIQFKLGDQNYAVQMKYVREISKPFEITELLGSPDFVQGVTKIKDKILTGEEVCYETDIPKEFLDLFIQ